MERIHATVSKECKDMLPDIQADFLKQGKHDTISNVVEQAIREMHKKLKKNK